MTLLDIIGVLFYTLILTPFIGDLLIPTKGKLAYPKRYAVNMANGAVVQLMALVMLTGVYYMLHAFESVIMFVSQLRN